MTNKIITMGLNKKIALVAHDNKKRDLVEWSKFNRVLLAHHKIFATGTTGMLLERELGIPITKLQSGPLGGDQQIGARIVDGEIDFLIFFWDPLEQQAHDPDVKALLRMAVVWNIPTACDRASADFMISSPLMDKEYDRLVPDYDMYRNRKVPGVETPPIPIPGVDALNEQNSKSIALVPEYSPPTGPTSPAAAPTLRSAEEDSATKGPAERRTI